LIKPYAGANFAGSEQKNPKSPVSQTVIRRMAPGKALKNKVVTTITIGNGIWHRMCHNGLELAPPF